MIERKTIFSPCRKYRYTLWREWTIQAGLPLRCERDGKSEPLPLRGSNEYVQFIALNPSTADEIQNNPTGQYR